MSTERPLYATTLFSLATILAESHGTWITEHAFAEDAYQYLTLSTDTRTLGPGTCFVPLVGERFDGHDYLEKAFAQGASLALVNQDRLEQHPEWRQFPAVIAVDDTLKAYLRMGRAHRRRLNPTVVAITGSSGKTTTKELMHAALSACRTTQKTEKNFNNEIGLTQTLLSIQPGCEILVAEMAMRGLHQIDVLSHYGEPDVAVVVNVGPAHIGLLGSMEAIAQAKCEIFSGLNPAKGVGICNGDDALLLATAKATWQGQLVPYQQSEVTNLRDLPQGGVAFEYKSIAFQVPLPGHHNVSNALAVIKTAEALGLPLEEIARGLAAYQPISGRWQQSPIPGTERGWVINDAYNANPSSMRAALESFLNIPFEGADHKVLVLGAMNELGDFSQRYHQELGAWLKPQSAVHACWFVGTEARPAYEAAQAGEFHTTFFETVSDLVAALPSLQHSCERPNWENTVFLLKGSRGIALEGVLEALNSLNESDACEVEPNVGRAAR